MNLPGATGSGRRRTEVLDNWVKPQQPREELEVTDHQPSDTYVVGVDRGPSSGRAPALRMSDDTEVRPS